MKNFEEKIQEEQKISSYTKPEITEVSYLDIVLGSCSMGDSGSGEGECDPREEDLDA